MFHCQFVCVVFNVLFTLEVIITASASIGSDLELFFGYQKFFEYLFLSYIKTDTGLGLLLISCLGFVNSFIHSF